jgi:hypothetical protein
MLGEELYNIASNDGSIFWRIAKDHGTFGTTVSSVEMQKFFSEHGKSMRDAFEKANRSKTPMDEHITALNPHLLAITKILHEARGNIADAHGFVEGIFKVVSLRDYIQRWEKENSKSHESLSPEEKRVLYLKATDHANKAIFDYSRVNSTVEFMRGSSTPFGIPFITFQYKAAGAFMYSALNHPIKLASMLATPTMVGVLGSLMGGLSADERDTVRRSLPKYKRNSFGTTIIPWKDSRGMASTIDLSYMLPFAQYLSAIREVYEGATSETTDMGSGVMSALGSMGFLGNPTTSTVIKLGSGYDNLGRRIFTPGASPAQHHWEAIHTIQDTVTPGWLRSGGWIRDMADTFLSDIPDKDRFGELKRTPGETIAGITGTEFQSASVRNGMYNRSKEFQQKLKELKTHRSRVIHDRSDKYDKATELKSIVEREKLIRAEMSEALKNNTNLK